MKQALFVVAGIMVVIGLVWIFQGIGVLPGSFMSGDIKWSFIGAIVVVAAGGLVTWANRRPAK